MSSSSLATPLTQHLVKAEIPKENVQNYHLQQVRDVLPLGNKSKTWDLSGHSKAKMEKDFGRATSLVTG